MNDSHLISVKVYSTQYWLFNITLLVTLILVMISSLMIGAAEIDFHMVWKALTTQDNDFESLIIRTVRTPRIISGALVGMALAAAGTLMQGLTQNSLALPGILGINAGAAFAIVCVLSIWGSPPN